MPEPTTHSQFGEDRLLAEIFSSTTGVCMEVGAFDGATGSATLAFEERGWTAILVEPLPEYAAAIRQRRRGPFFEAAAGAVEATVTFRRARSDPATSSLSSATIQAALYALRGESCEEFAVPQRTLDAMLAETGVSRIDFATIDVEGAELDVLRGWDLARWRPRVLIVEDNSRGTDRRVARWLRAAGYVCFHHTVVNDWFARTEDRALATSNAVMRQNLRIAWRHLRALGKHLTPAVLKSWLRRLSLAGE